MRCGLIVAMLLAVCAIPCRIVVAQQDGGPVHSTQGSIYYPVPTGAIIDECDVDLQNGLFTVTFKSTIPTSVSGYFFTQVLLCDSEGAILRKLIINLGQNQLLADPPIQAYSSVLMDPASGLYVTTSPPVINGNTLTTSVNPNQVLGLAFDSASSYFAPNVADLRGLGGVPGIRVSTVRDGTGSGNRYLAVESSAGIGLRQVIPHDQYIYIPVPQHLFPNSYNGQPPLCPSTNGSSSGTGDISGDGVPDWSYVGADDVSGGGAPSGTKVDFWGWNRGGVGMDASDSFVIVIGHDDNGNGEIDPEEIDDWIGMCVWDNGENQTYENEVDGRYIHHVSVDPANGRKVHFIYDKVTGKLKVYTSWGWTWGPGDPDDFDWHSGWPR